jgi:hypothetical protein
VIELLALGFRLLAFAFLIASALIRGKCFLLSSPISSDQCHLWRFLLFPITAMSRDDGDPGDSCDPLPASFSHRPTPHKRFVENKSQTPIRPNGRPSGRSPFSRFSEASIRLNFSLVFSFLLSGRQRVATGWSFHFG